MKKVIEFTQTTKGFTATVNGIITWFIRDEPRIKPNESWFVYKSEDGGKGFKLIPAKAVRDEDGCATTGSTWGWNTLNAAKAFVYQQELLIAE